MNMLKVLPIAFLLVVSSVFAIPGVPHHVDGTVTINGAPAPDGTVVSARISGTEVVSNTILGGYYGRDGAPIFKIPDTDPPSRAGQTVNFFVNGVDSGSTIIFQNGASTHLNLAATIAAPPGSGGSGGGGGGGSGGSGITGQTTAPTNTTPPANPVNTQESGPCTERWLCTDWSWCVNSFQTRQCEDVNKCGTDIYGPLESQPCGQEEGTWVVPFIGLAISDPAVAAEAGIFVIAIILIAYVLWRKMKSAKKGKK